MALPSGALCSCSSRCDTSSSCGNDACLTAMPSKPATAAQRCSCDAASVRSAASAYTPNSVRCNVAAMP